ncbi:glycosyltransferase [Salinicola halophyticus]|uniref:glycosyltransferase n=1 Tax=Salinicola halophyticus TaxID=1808881 RepID=UPI000DA24858|nr:glycosyltransferase [Salinicola halophyticus]
MFSHVEFLKKTSLFDSSWYASHYRDVSILRANPEEHFHKYGEKLNRVGSEDFLYKDSASYFSYLHSHAKEYKEASKLGIESKELAVKLRSGYENLSLLLLMDMVENKSEEKTERGNAAWELARVLASQKDWSKARYYLNKARYFNPSFMRRKKPRLLEIEALINVGELDRAADKIEYPLKKGIDSDFLCSKTNLHIAKGESDEAIISIISEIYTSNFLSPLEFKKNRLAARFDNICSRPVSQINLDVKVSVLMPVYNAEEHLRVSLESLLNQTYSNLEVVAVDDCSSDGSWEMLKSYAATDSRLKIYKNEKNLSAYPTRNRALSLATGEVITVHDSDDWSHPQMIECQLEKLLATNETKLTFSFMARVSPELYFSLRPERNNMEYVHRSYPSLMIRRGDLEALGEWDGIVANADDEFLQRARKLFGTDAIIDVFPNVPMSLFLKHEASLTSSAKTSLKSLDYGVRKEYGKQAEFWRNRCKNRADLKMERTGEKFPFPVPNGLSPQKRGVDNRYDIILISDLSLLGGTRRCNEAYIESAVDLGLKIGMFHWPRFDLRFAKDIAAEYRLLSFNPGVDILTWEDEVSCEALLIHHPPILKYQPDLLPTIKTDKVFILVNQSPMQLRSQEPHYYFKNDVEETCQRNFGRLPVWIAISPSAKEVLQKCGYEYIHDEIWYPPLSEKIIESQKNRTSLKSNRNVPVVGRHARDHWTKWPSNPQDIELAYMADSEVEVRLMGGVRYPKKLLEKIPQNWVLYDFDSVSVVEFLDDLDFFVHFVHCDYIEEFGRNIAEAMARGVVVILPWQFEAIFKDAACYTEPSGVYDLIQELWSNPGKYLQYRQNGLKFVEKNVHPAVTKMRVESLVDTSNLLVQKQLKVIG